LPLIAIIYFAAIRHYCRFHFRFSFDCLRHFDDSPPPLHYAAFDALRYAISS